ncbi:MAG: enoyl-CoA hydratase-related protein [Vicinamibacterales bacterium]
MGTGPLSVERLDQGAIWRVAIGGSKGNVLDAAVMDALTDLFRSAATSPHLKAICLEGQGAHFSFGASVPEHLPPLAEGMLARFHGALFAMLDSAVPVLAAVRGQCLGGGLELVSLCHQVFATRDARLGQPEIVLGVFAPVASLVLGDRVGRGAADGLCLSGRSITAEEAFALRLVDQIVEGDPALAAIEWARTHLVPKSASSLRYAVRASRAALRGRLTAELPAIERLYLGGLMSTADAIEGLNAFVERRPAVWRDA